jgi:hypothetical protein
MLRAKSLGDCRRAITCCSRWSANSFATKMFTLRAVIPGIARGLSFGLSRELWLVQVEFS